MKKNAAAMSGFAFMKTYRGCARNRDSVTGFHREIKSSVRKLHGAAKGGGILGPLPLRFYPWRSALGPCGHL
jgi:hypothetical protein